MGVESKTFSHDPRAHAPDPRETVPSSEIHLPHDQSSLLFGGIAIPHEEVGDHFFNHDKLHPPIDGKKINPSPLPTADLV